MKVNKGDVILPVTLEDLEEFHLYINKDKVLRPNTSHGQVQTLLLLLPPPPLNFEKFYEEKAELLSNQAKSSFTPINQPESLFVFSSAPSFSYVLVPSTALTLIACAFSIPAGPIPIFDALFFEFLSSAVLLLIPADSDWSFSPLPTVKNKIKPPFSSAPPKTDSATEFLDLKDRLTDFTELDWKILRESTSAFSSKSSLEPVGSSQKQTRKKEKVIKGNKKRQEIRNNNLVESKFLMTGTRKVGTAADKLPERGAITPAPCDKSKTMAMIKSKDKGKKKIRITKQQKEPRCGCRAAVRKKWKKTIGAKSQ